MNITYDILSSSFLGFPRTRKNTVVLSMVKWNLMFYRKATTSRIPTGRTFDSPSSVQKILNTFSWSNNPLCELNPTVGGERKALLKLNKVFEVAAAQNFWASHSDFLSSNRFLFFLKRGSARRAVSIKIQGNQRIITVGLDTLRAKQSLIRVAPMYWSDIGAKPVLCAHRVSVRKVSFRPV